MKKGFTLIELLAVIIILAIVALIATPIVLDVVNDAKESAAKSEAAMIVSGVNNYCAAASMQEQLTGKESICTDADGVTKEDVATMVDLGNAKVNKITYEGKVTLLEIESNNKVVTYDGSNYTIDGEIVDTPDIPVTPTPTPTYTAYSVGDEVALIDGTTWIVVKNSTISESEIKLMSTSNVHPNLTNETGTAMFLDETIGGYNLAYDSNNSNVWSTSTLKAYLDSTVKTKLETSLNTSISDITIWGVEELTALGCTVTGNDVDGYSEVSCDNTKEWYTNVFDTYSWTKVPYADSSSVVWLVRGTGDFHYTRNVDYSKGNGARPVITVSKEAIKKYYAFGTPTTESSVNYQDVINSSGSNVIVKLDGEQLSVCMYRNNSLECFKKNGGNEITQQMQNLFGSDKCTLSDVDIHCVETNFDCRYNYEFGSISCGDWVNNHYCYIDSANGVDCQ